MQPHHRITTSCDVTTLEYQHPSELSLLHDPTVAQSHNPIIFPMPRFQNPTIPEFHNSIFPQSHEPILSQLHILRTQYSYNPTIYSNRTTPIPLILQPHNPTTPQSYNLTITSPHDPPDPHVLIPQHPKLPNPTPSGLIIPPTLYDSLTLSGVLFYSTITS